MAKTTYYFMFRCRYCGKEYKEGATGDENLAFHCLFSATTGTKPPTPQAPHLLSAHFTDDHMGVSDFIGVKKESDEEDKDGDIQ